MMDKLLPCPFCGTAARSVHRVNSNVVTCLGCGASVRQSAMGQGDADDRWNTRADACNQSAIARLREALQGAIGALEFSRDYHADLGNEEQAFAQDKLDAALAALEPKP